MVEGARKGDVVGTFFGVAGEDDVGGVILGGEELEGSGVFEGMDGVLFGELYGVGLFEGVLLLGRARLSEPICSGWEPSRVGGVGGVIAEGLTRSPRACRVRSLVEVPDSSSVFFWFSTSLAPRSSSARLERALRGFLRNVNSRYPHIVWRLNRGKGPYLHCANHGCGVGTFVCVNRRFRFFLVVANFFSWRRTPGNTLFH